MEILKRVIQTYLKESEENSNNPCFYEILLFNFTRKSSINIINGDYNVLTITKNECNWFINFLKTFLAIKNNRIGVHTHNIALICSDRKNIIAYFLAI